MFFRVITGIIIAAIVYLVRKPNRYRKLVGRYAGSTQLLILKPGENRRRSSVPYLYR